jgi:methyl-accepting chemotaxis protein
VQNVLDVGIVGGGKVGAELLGLFGSSDLTRVVYMVDRDERAPGILAAREKSVSTYTDIETAVSARHADFIFEVTGSGRVVETLRQAVAGRATDLVTHDMAHAILGVVEQNRQRTTANVLDDTMRIKQDITQSLSAMTGAIEGIKRTTQEMHLLALNARLEAARAGDRGRSFDVVAQEVQASAESVRKMAQEVEQVNVTIVSASERIESAMQRLR